jgi:hypothetical protein
MPDVYASITAADPATLERLTGALELRAADLLRRGILKEFVSEISLPKEAKVLEIGHPVQQRPGPHFFGYWVWPYVMGG